MKVTNKMKQYPNPNFHSPEEEEKYWQSRSPLTEGYKGKIQKTKQQRNSFLSVRLTGEELIRLREQASFHMMTPSAYVRKLIQEEIKKKFGPDTTISEAVTKEPIPYYPRISTLMSEFVRNAYERDSSFYNVVKEAMQAYSNYINKEAEVRERISSLLLQREGLENQKKVKK